MSFRMRPQATIRNPAIRSEDPLRRFVGSCGTRYHDGRMANQEQPQIERSERAEGAKEGREDLESFMESRDAAFSKQLDAARRDVHVGVAETVWKDAADATASLDAKQLRPFLEAYAVLSKGVLASPRLRGSQDAVRRRLVAMDIENL